ncbi:MAG: GTP pyrophosphokinase [bacterium]
MTVERESEILPFWEPKAGLALNFIGSARWKRMLLEDAIQIATEAHRGQTGRDGAPYILHPLRVMQNAASPQERIVAVLHDVVERSAWTLDGLKRRGLPDDLAAAVDALTRRDGEDYPDFVQRAGRNRLGRSVKRLDLQDHIAHATGASAAQLAKYETALASLRSD